MITALYITSALALSVWVVLVWLPGWLLNSCSIAVVLLIYCSGYMQTFIPVRIAVLAVGVLMLTVVVASGRKLIGSRTQKAVLVAVAAMGILFAVGSVVASDSAIDPLLRFTLLFPIVGITGFLLGKTENIQSFSRSYVIVSIIMALLAIAERASGSFLVAGSYASTDRLIRDGTIRSIVLSEHPLVLSVMLLAAIPLVSSTFKNLPLVLLAYVTLAGGVVSTNSRGAIIIFVAWVLLWAAGKAGALGAKWSQFARMVVVVAVVTAFLWTSLGSGSDEMSSSSALDASAEYRSSLYAFAGRSLTEMPLGWGLEGLPEGVYLVSSYFGTLDVAKTVDSEIALAVFDFGWAGLVGITSLFICQLGIKVLTTPIGQSGLMISASGTYLALHAWVGLGTLWVLVVGLSFGAAQHLRTKAKPDTTTQRTKTTSMAGIR